MTWLLGFVFAFLAPDDAPAWMKRGVEQAVAGDYAMAEASFRKACALDGKLPGACLFHGRTLYLLDRFEEALEVLRPVNDIRAVRIMALCLDGLGRWKDAEREYERAIKVQRGFVAAEDARIDYGVALMRQGRTEEAVAPLEAALRNAPSGRVYLELGRVLLQLGRVEEAAGRLREAVRLEPESGAAHLLLGKVLMRLGRKEEAEEHLRLGSARVR